MNANERLRTLLENVAKRYTTADVAIEFDEQPRIANNGETIYTWTAPGDVLGIDLSAANELRVIRDTVNHEAAHYKWSALDGKAAFAARYPEHSKLAGGMLNRLEDSYIDSRRLGEYPGLRGAHALFVESQMSDATPVDELDDTDALVMAIDYYALAGRVPGIKDADDDLRAWAAWVKRHVDEYRRTDDAFEREHIAARIVDELIDRLDDDADTDDLGEAMADGASGELPDDYDVENMPDMNTPDDDDVAEVAADHELPDAPEPSESDTDDDYRDETREDEQPGGESGETDDAGESDESEPQGEGDGDEGDESSGDDGDTESGDTADESDESEPTDGGDGSGGSPTDDVDDLADELDELDERDERGESPEHHGLDADTDYETASEADERRAEQVENPGLDYGHEHDVESRRRDRDKKAASMRKHLDTVRSSDVPHEQVRTLLRKTGLAEDVRDAFELFATNDVTVSAESGDRLNTEAVIRHMAGDYTESNVYEKDYEADSGGRVIGASIDTSGSTDTYGSKDVRKHTDGCGSIVDSKAALGALYLAADELGDVLVATGFSNSGTELITAPGESFKWQHLDAVTHGGGTPTATAILETLDLVEREPGREKIIFVVTDGNATTNEPAFIDDGDRAHAHDSKDHAARAAEFARSKDVEVIGIGVGTSVSDRDMAKMFGDDGYIMASSDDVVEELVEVYAEQLDYEEPAGY